MKFKDATIEEIDALLQKSWSAFAVYRKVSIRKRSDFMYQVAAELEALGDQLLDVTHKETNLPEARLRNERTRTIFQLRSYADACANGNWMDIRIDTADLLRNPPKPDLRKMLVPMGPVVVFGASNFPYAYSTAGGDTACAFAAGCPVIVKAHPAHAETSEMVAGAIHKAVAKMNFPEGVFGHVHGASFETGRALVTHSYTKAVGFTGSFQGGKALFDWANERKDPIPVFAEMGSVNPVFLFPQKLKTDAEEVAKLCAGSVTLGVGQFCTNPGLLIALDSEGLPTFIHSLGDEIKKISAGKMLHQGIAQSYMEKRKKALEQKGVEIIAAGINGETEEGLATIAMASADAFLNNPVLHQEVFGPYSLVVKCANKDEMLEVVKNLEGQLTASVMATNDDVLAHEETIDSIREICGRFIFNNVPTGVEVCLAMQHGGPFPATTDSRFTSVGADGIRRFARPVAYQSWPDELLPDELKNSNPLGVWRVVNNEPGMQTL